MAASTLLILFNNSSTYHMKKSILILLSVFMLGMASCQKETLKGSGDIITENRTADAFTNIDIEGDPKLFITYGPVLQLSVTGYANLVPQFETRISNNELKAKFKSGSNIKNNNIEVHITMPVLTVLTTSGSVNTQIAGIFPYTSAIKFKVDGAGNTAMENGSTGNLSVETSGSGSYNLLGLKAEEADVKISGSGEVKTQANKVLQVKINGSGNVYYQGNPALEVEINGSGKIIKY
jgi:hypothetical protein